jgi:hypothetical protein
VSAIGFTTRKSSHLIAIDNDERLGECTNFTGRFVPMPLQITTHPEDAPVIFRSHEGRLGRRRFATRRLVLPIGANLEDLYAVSFDSIAKVELRTNVRGRPTSLEE